MLLLLTNHGSPMQLKNLSKLKIGSTSSFIENRISSKETIFEYFKTYRNHLVTIIRMNKENYFQKYFNENKKDTKKVQSAIRSIVNVKQTNRYQPSNLIIENKTVSISVQQQIILTTSLIILLVRLTKRLDLVTKPPMTCMQSFYRPSQSFRYNHNMLISKLKYYGICGIPLTWLRSYLHNRFQYIPVNGTESELLLIKHGVSSSGINFGATTIFALYQQFTQGNYFFKNTPLC